MSGFNRVAFAALCFLLSVCGTSSDRPGSAGSQTGQTGQPGSLPEPGQQVDDKVAMLQKEHEAATKLATIAPEDQKASVSITREMAYLRDRLGYLLDRRLVEVHERGPAIVVVLNSDSLFRSGSSLLSASGRRLVLQVNEALLGLRSKRFQVEGHADDRTGRGASNWDLAYKRAMSVMQIMIAHSMPSYRISASSFGSTRPHDTNDTVQGRAMNRRVEIAVMEDHYKYPWDAGKDSPEYSYKTPDPAATPQTGSAESEYQKYLREREQYLRRQSP